MGRRPGSLWAGLPTSWPVRGLHAGCMDVFVVDGGMIHEDELDGHGGKDKSTLG